MSDSSPSLPGEVAAAARIAQLTGPGIPAESPRARVTRQVPDRVARRGLGAVLAALAGLLSSRPSAAQSAGLITRPSAHDVLRPRTVVVFGNPRAGTPAMAEHPTLALDLPMRVLVWQDEIGRTFVTRSTGDDLAERVFGRHGTSVPAEGRRQTDTILEGFVTAATA